MTPVEIKDITAHKFELEDLGKAFISFSEAAQKVQEYYTFLEQRVEELKIELEQKNVILEQNFIEKDKLYNYFHNVLESLTAGIVGINNNGKITFVNSTIHKFFSLNKSDVIQGDAANVFDLYFDTTLLKEAIAEKFGKRRVFEFTQDTQDEVIKKEFRITITKATDSQEGTIGGLMIVEDISEMRRLERQAMLTNRLRAMGEIAVNVAHEVRNPLGSIELFASMLQQDLENLPAQQRLAENILTGVHNIENIVSNILYFTKMHPIRKRPTDIAKILNESIVFIEHSIKQKDAKIVKENLNKRCIIEIEPELIKQVFLNLLLNAIQAIDNKGTVFMSLQSTDAEIQVRISDDGIGISEKIRDKIFDPFFTTKKLGTGLGLTIAHNIIHAHNGMIEVTERQGKGTTFIITLPKK